MTKCQWIVTFMFVALIVHLLGCMLDCVRCA